MDPLTHIEGQKCYSDCRYKILPMVKAHEDNTRSKQNKSLPVFIFFYIIKNEGKNKGTREWYG